MGLRQQAEDADEVVVTTIIEASVGAAGTEEENVVDIGVSTGVSGEGTVVGTEAVIEVVSEFLVISVEEIN